MTRQEQAVTITPEAVVAVFNEVNPEMISFLGFSAQDLCHAAVELRVRQHEPGFDRELAKRELAERLVETALGGHAESHLHEDAA